jgi:hypothetical protein
MVLEKITRNVLRRMEIFLWLEGVGCAVGAAVGVYAA